MDSAKYRKVFSALPEIETERLLLRKMTLADAGEMYAYSSLSEVTRHLLWSPHINIDETKGYIEYVLREYRRGDFADWGVVLKDTKAFIGTIGFAAVDTKNNSGEIGYVLNPVYQGRGLMSEAVKAILRVGFILLGLRRVQARIMEENISSARLVEKAGFRYEGTLRDALYVKGAYRTIKMYAMLSADYFSALTGTSALTG